MAYRYTESGRLDRRFKRQGYNFPRIPWKLILIVLICICIWGLFTDFSWEGVAWTGSLLVIYFLYTKFRRKERVPSESEAAAADWLKDKDQKTSLESRDSTEKNT